jgi:hypothetical protein
MARKSNVKAHMHTTGAKKRSELGGRWVRESASRPPQEVFWLFRAVRLEVGIGERKGSPAEKADGCATGGGGGQSSSLKPGGLTPLTGRRMQKANGASRQKRRKFMERKRIIMHSSSVYSQSAVQRGGHSSQRRPRHHTRGG